MLLGLLVFALFMVLTVLPGMWVRNVLARHSVERPEFPGTGGEFARHLLDEMKLRDVKVELTERGDHYDPVDKAVRLSPAHMDKKSLAAVVVAAHEVGHAMQDATDYAPLKNRIKLARQAHWFEMLGSIIMLLSPVLLLLMRAPAAMLVELGLGLVVLSFGVLLHVVTLPVEFDASFRRALPVLEAGRYVADADMAAAREILKAAAFTYVAAAAMSLVNIGRWLRVLRF